nr:uncharacterized protein LOC124807208 [Hydra vulgaris]
MVLIVMTKRFILRRINLHHLKIKRINMIDFHYLKRKQRVQNIGGKNCQKCMIGMMKSFMKNSFMIKFNMAAGKDNELFQSNQAIQINKSLCVDCSLIINRVDC